jgi:DNA modification methylase
MKKGEFDLSKIQPHPTNPRTISEQEVQFLERSLQAHPEFLKAHPIAYCSQTGYIFGGNQRYKALVKLGYTSVPQNWVQDISDWGEGAKIEFMFIDNKQSGEWDWDIINTEYEALELGDWGIIEQESAPIESEQEELILECVEDDYNEEAPEAPKTVLGDLYEIGEHRLICGDSTDSDVLARLMNEKRAGISFTSPPYNVERGFNSNAKNGGKKYEKCEDNMLEQDYSEFLSVVLQNNLLFADEVFINIGLVKGNKKSLFDFISRYAPNLKDVFYWVKNTSMPQGFHDGMVNNLVEPIYAFGLDDKRIFKNPQYGKGTLWNVIKGNSAGLNEFSKIHSATFPLYLPEFFIVNFTPENTIVLDVFLGTGTTMVAAHQLKRKCYGIELDPKYCDVIIKRMLKLDANLTVKRNGKSVTSEFV